VNTYNRERPASSEFKGGGRRSIRLSPEQLIRTCPLDPEGDFALVVEPAVDNLNLITWAGNNLEFIERQLLKYGALLFRNFNVELVSQFQMLAGIVSKELLSYQERAAPRVQIDDFIYTSTEYPADQHIPLHHEMSYSHNWPKKIYFFCAEPPQLRGRTPIADDRKIFQLVDPRIKKRFLEKKVLYIRNYGRGLDLPWQDVFQTDDRSIVEQYCRKAHMDVEWRSDGRLRTRAIRQAVVTHPMTGSPIWFNHAHMFHVSNLQPATREALLSEFREDELPRNAFYGDGSPIESSVLDEIRELYDRTAISFPWQKGDILMLDNFLASHGREPYAGQRKILVAMADLFTNPDI
jgi:alpha-ketoglutarate-dependent taurine dioxygenase